MPRNMIGYGRCVPDVCWPNGAKVAVNFVINYEEGSERSPVNGDDYAETYGGEFPLVAKIIGQRSFSMESLFEYGSRVGIWRLVRLFDEERCPVTFFATGQALKLNPDFCSYLTNSAHEVAGHGWRWIDYATLSKKEEQDHIKRCIHTIETLTNRRVYGWYTGRRSEYTRLLLQEIAALLYDSDSYADDLPYYEGRHLIIPYNLDCNDFRYTTSPGFQTANDFFKHLKNTLMYLLDENRPALMTIGLHPRISGRAGRMPAIKHFIQLLKTTNSVWVATRIDVAKHWLRTFPAKSD